MQRLAGSQRMIGGLGRHSGQEARDKGYVETIFGRKVWLPQIKSPNGADALCPTEPVPTQHVPTPAAEG